MLEKYGRSSPQFIASLYLVDAAVGKIVSSMSSLYSDRLVSEIVLLGSHPSYLTSYDTRTVFAQLSRLLPREDNGALSTHYPNLYIDSSSTDLQDVCRVLSIELQRSGVDVFCPSYFDRSLLVTSELYKTRTLATTSTTTNSTTVNIALYQITLWISIVLVLTY